MAFVLLNQSVSLNRPGYKSQLQSTFPPHSGISWSSKFVVLSIFLHSVEVVCHQCHFHQRVSICELYLSSDRNLDLDTSLDVDDDLLNNLGRGVETVK